jgi:hypothetical protein
VDEGFRFGQLGLQIFQRFKIHQWTGRVYALYYGLLHSLKLPIRDAIIPLKYAYVVSLEKGDIEFGFLCGINGLWMQNEIEPLENLNNDIRFYVKQMVMFGQYHNLEMLKALHLTVRTFLSQSWLHVNPSTENIIEEKDYDNIKTPSNIIVGWSHVCRLWLYYMFGHFEKSFYHLKAAVTTGILTNNAETTKPFILLLIGLADVANARCLGIRKLTQARKCVKMLEALANHAPCNFLGKQYLLEAELASFENNHEKALQRFTCAIALAKKSGFLMENALGCELAGKALLRRSDRRRAAPFLDEAVIMYQQWGSVRKAANLLCEMENEKAIS